MISTVQLRAAASAWPNGGGLPRTQSARLQIFAPPPSGQGVLNAVERPVLVLEFRPNWNAQANGATLTLTGDVPCDFASGPLSSSWIVRAEANRLVLVSATIGGRSLNPAGEKPLTETGPGLIAFNPLAVGGRGVDVTKQFLAVGAAGETPVRQAGNVDAALVRESGGSTFGLAMAVTGSWNSPGGQPVHVRRNGTQPPVVVFNVAFLTGNAPAIRLVEALARSGNRFVRTLSIAGIPGRGLLEAWNIHAQEWREARVNAQRATFIPEVVDEANKLTTSQTSWWMLTAMLNDDLERYVAAGAQPIVPATASLRYSLKGVRSHVGEMPEIDGFVYPGPARIDPTLNIPSLKLDALVPAVLGMIGHEVGGAGGIANIAFELRPKAVVPAGGAPTAKPPTLRFDELDLELFTDAGSTIPDRPLISVASRSAESFLDASPGATVTSSSVRFAGGNLRPGGDGLAGRRSVDDDVEPSLIIPLRIGAQHSAIDLLVDETPRTGAVDSLIRAALYARRIVADKDPAQGLAIVVGNRPSFLLAVSYPGLVVNEAVASTSQPIAQWIFDPNPPGGRAGQRGWTPGAALLTKSELQWSTILPAQGIAEEIERAGTLKDRASTPLDFRVGDPAVLKLRLPATVPGVNRLFPWNAFRVFMDPLNAQGSPVLESAHLELLVGMPCDVGSLSTSAFVLVDPLRRLGLLPLALPCALQWLDQTADHRAAFKNAREEWTSARRAYSTRLLLLEPVPQDKLYYWEPALIPATRISCTLWRPDQRDMQSPIVDWDGAAPLPRPLRGGAAWGIRQGPIYRALFEPKSGEDVKSIKSVDALLSELSMSSVGGTGHVMAGFPDADAAPAIPPGTRIAADVSFGKLARYTVTRRGRIGVFGHPAVHVSVYERTTVPSEQFGPLQPTELKGRPMVRLTAEYVEVTNPVARLARSAAEEPAAGFVGACAFPPNVRINVLSEWGSDVGTIGWKVPLWNRTAAAAQPTVYPRPGVSLLMAVEADPGNPQALKERASAILNPDVLCFFTRTDGVDAASLEPVEGVDFTLLPPPQPTRVPTTTADPAVLAELLVDDPPVPAGYEPFTFLTNPGDDPALVTANRSDQRDGVRARVHSVTVTRGPIFETAQLSPAQRAWSDSVQKLDELNRHVEAAGAAIGDMAERLESAASQLGGNTPKKLLAAIIETPSGSQVNWPAGVSAQAKSAVETSRARYVKALGAIGAARATARDLRIANFATAANVQLEIAKSALKAQIAPYVERTSTRIVEILDKQIAALSEEMRRHGAPIDLPEAVREFRRAVQGLIVLLASVDPDRVRVELERGIRAYVEMSDAWMAVAREAKKTTGPLTETGARTFLLESRNRLAAAARQLSDSAAGWLMFIGPLVSQLEHVASAQLDEISKQMAPWSLDSFQAAVIDAASKLRTEIATQAGSLKLPTLTMPADTSAAWPTVAAELRHAHELFARLEVITVAAEANVASWGAFPLQPQVAATALEKELTQVLEKLQGELTPSANGVVDKVLAQSLDILDAVSTATRDFAQYEILTPLGNVEALLRQHIDDIKTSAASAEAMANALGDRVRGEAQGLVSKVAQELKPFEEVARGADSGARLLRALGDAPTAQELEFVQSRLAYVFPRNDPRLIELSTTVARVCHGAKALGAIDDKLKSFGIDIPVTELRNALLRPADALLKQFDFNKVFRDLAGMPLLGLFSGVKMPELPDKVRVRHEVDAASRRARVYADVDDLPLNDGSDVPVFDVGVLALVLRRPSISAHVGIESSSTSVQTRQETRGSIQADWAVRVGGAAVVTLRRARIEFARPGGLKFDIDATRIELADALRFLTNLLASSGSGSGLSFGAIQSGFEAVLAAELPALALGTFAITNLALGVRFALQREGDQFIITLGAFVGRRSAPFAITVFILGGGGFLEVDARYAVGGAITARVALGINAAASLGIALGPIRGSIFAAVGFAVYYTSGAGGSLRYEVFFLLSGTVSVLSLITVSIELGLSLEYDGRRFIGQGTFRCTIKIGFFKIKVKAGVRYELGCLHAHEVPQLASSGMRHFAEAQSEAQMLVWAQEYVHMYV